MKDGEIVETGTYQELLEKHDSEFFRLTLSKKTKKPAAAGATQAEEKVEGTKEEEEEKEEESDKESEADPEEDPEDQTIDAEKKLDGTTDKIDSDSKKEGGEGPPKELSPEETAAKEEKALRLTAAKKLDAENRKTKKGALTGQEIRSTGAVPGRVYKDYLTAGGCCALMSTVIIYIIAQTLVQVNDWWLTSWSTQRFNDYLNNLQYIYIYGGLSLVTGVMTFMRGFAFSKFTLGAALSLHRKLIQSLMKTPMSWFDITPSGRIINRCTKDQDDVDTTLPFTIQFAFGNLLQLFSIMILVNFLKNLWIALFYL